MAEKIVSKTYRVLRDEAEKAWDRISFWTKASSVEFNDGMNAEDKLGAIKGITSDMNSNSETTAASINAVNQLYTQLNGLSFAQDEYGEWGYKTGGADSVTPFRKSSMIKLAESATNSSMTIDVGKFYNGNLSRLTNDNFMMQQVGINNKVGNYNVTDGEAGGPPEVVGFSLTHQYNYDSSTKKGTLTITSRTGQTYGSERYHVDNGTTNHWGTTYIWFQYSLNYIPYLITGERG